MGRQTGQLILTELLSICVMVRGLACRDRFQWPFAGTSIWNTPLGTGAHYAPAGLYPNTSAPVGSRYGPPNEFHNDQDFFVLAKATDPQTPWINQGSWGPANHCTVVAPGLPATNIPFPRDFTTASDGGRSAPWQDNNNAMGVLLPDNRTLVQMQPIYRCNPGLAG